jgi:serine/threonine protein kinase
MRPTSTPVPIPEVRDIAVGSFGRVYAALLSTGDTVAIKGAQIANESEYRCLYQLGQARIPHTITAIAALRNAGPPLLPEPCQLAIAMTHVHGTTLREYLTARAILGQPLGMPLVRQWTGQIVNFLLHAQVKLGLSHDDLKLGNIMVSEQRELKIVDMTFAGPKRADEWHCGTLCYMPPERLFHGARPSYATTVGPDIWAVGVLMATMALTGQTLSNVLTARESFYVTDDQGRFDPSRTNTVYDLLSDREPWFSGIVSALCKSSGYDRNLVTQAIRLVLWSRARVVQRDTFRIPQCEDQAMPGFSATILCRLVAENMDGICAAYNGSGTRVYERVWEYMRQCMGEEMYLVWRGTQQWDPRIRGTLDELQNRIGLYPGVDQVADRRSEHVTPVPWIHDRVDTFIQALYDAM